MSGPRDRSASYLAFGSTRVTLVVDPEGTPAIPPPAPPVTVEDVAIYRRVGFDEVANLEALIAAAAERVELDTGRALTTRTLDVVLDAFPSRLAPVLLPQPPLQSVVSVTTFDHEDAETALDPAMYFADTASEPGRLLLRNGHAWPHDLRRFNGVVIRITAGYTQVPSALIAAMQYLIGNLWEHREKTMVSQFAGQFIELPEYEALIAPYRLVMMA